jgi:molecular chaperone HscA
VFLTIQEKAQDLLETVPSFAVGIDFGTTFCAVAICRKAHQPEMLGSLIPSVVSYDALGGALVGEEALGSGLAYASSVKRHLDPQGAHQPWFNSHSPFEIAVDLFVSLHRRCTEAFGEEALCAVVTVPAYFDEMRRQLIKKAAEKAGFRVLRLLAEPTAAALNFGITEEGTYGIYDLGGGTFDFSVLTLQQGIFRVLATGGHAALGGDDFDEILGEVLYPGHVQARHLARQYKEKNALSKEEAECLRPLIQKTLSICHATLKDANVALCDLKGVLLVGGATRLSVVHEELEKTFGTLINSTLHPDQAVVLGAAIQAYNLTHEHPFLLLDVAPLTLGLETMGGIVEPIIPRNSVLPVRKTQSFTTSETGQTRMSIHVLQGEQELVAHCRSLGSFELSDIPPLPKGKARIQVIFHLDVDGLLTVSACVQDPSEGILTEKSLVVNALRDLSEAFVRTSTAKEGEDILERLWITKKNQSLEAIQEVRRLLILEDQTANLAHFVAMEKACIDLEERLMGTPENIEEALPDLIRQWENFTELAVPFVEMALKKWLKNHFEGY